MNDWQVDIPDGLFVEFMKASINKLTDNRFGFTTRTLDPWMRWNRTPVNDRGSSVNCIWIRCFVGIALDSCVDC